MPGGIIPADPDMGPDSCELARPRGSGGRIGMPAMLSALPVSASRNWFNTGLGGGMRPPDARLSCCSFALAWMESSSLSSASVDMEPPCAAAADVDAGSLACLYTGGGASGGGDPLPRDA